MEMTNKFGEFSLCGVRWDDKHMGRSCEQLGDYKRKML